MGLIKKLKDVFDLALGTTEFVNELVELTKEQDYSKVANSGDGVQVANSGDYAKVANSGYFAKVANSGEFANVANSGEFTNVANSGKLANVANSGDVVQVANSGDYANVANSGKFANVANSGEFAKVANNGESCVIANIGIFGTVKSSLGSWVTLAFYEKNAKGRYLPNFVKTEFVDGKKIKADIEYCLYKTEFREVLTADGIRAAVISKKGNVYKVWCFGDSKESFVYEENGIFSHGATLKEARDSLIYKIGSRDTSPYKAYTLDTVVSKEEAIKMYRVITGACEYGVKRFVDSLLKTKKKYKIKEIVQLADGQYGHLEFKMFFEAKHD